MTTALPDAATAPPILAVKPPRLQSLDAFRGATIVGMILVNNPGSWAKGMRYAPLDHAEWHGCTPTDWIFPFFLFIVGVAIPFSQAKRSTTTGSLIPGILRRSAILFGLGILLGLIPYSSTTGFFNLGGLRIPGVLQRIAVCYLVAATLAVFLGWRGMVAAGIAVLVIYSGLMLFVSAPGFSAGDLSKEGNLAHYIDKMVFGKHGYGAYNDPEGLLSTLPAIGTVICGWLVGTWLRRPDRTQPEKISAVFAFGVIGMIAGEILHHALMPINKQIWTPSYVIYTAGLACLGLGLCYWIIDIRGYQKWARPLVACGMNAITIFFLAGVIGRLMNAKVISVIGENGEAAKQAIKPWLYQTLFTPYLSPLNASLVWALVFVGFFIALAMVMDRMKVYLKV